MDSRASRKEAGPHVIPSTFQAHEQNLKSSSKPNLKFSRKGVESDLSIRKV